MGRYNLTKEEAERVYSLVRHTPERPLSEWSDDEKALFERATDASNVLQYSSDFQIWKALKPLNNPQICSLLKEIRSVDGVTESGSTGLYASTRGWHKDSRSLKAMSSEMSREELIIVRDTVFGGLDEWLTFVFDGQFETTEVLRSDDVLLPITFPDGIVPLKYFAKTVSAWVENKINPNLYDVVVTSARHHLCQGGPLVVGIVQGALFDRVSDNLPRHIIARATLLKAIYEPEAGPVYQPTADAWMTLIFNQAHNVCNVDPNQNEAQEADDSEYDVLEVVFCDKCESEVDDIGRSACTCWDTRLHVDECRFLMEMDVPIPREFFDRLAYHNQWRLAHYLHTHKREFNLNIPVSALHKAVEYDRVGFVKFLLQYGYFDATDVPPGADLSTKMRECLGTGTRKRRRDALVSAQSALDELKEEMPEGVYLKLCTSFQTAFNQ